MRHYECAGNRPKIWPVVQSFFTPNAPAKTENGALRPKTENGVQGWENIPCRRVKNFSKIAYERLVRAPAVCYNGAGITRFVCFGHLYHTV